ncbi:hypothetical protein PIB30_111282, partial [Stylosanthes scabra]|nr:hypothetical protein [Stylosanthes scabra]
QQQPKPEPQPPPPLSKPEPHELAAKKEDIDEPTTHTKSEPNGTAKTEFVPKSEAQDVTEQDDPMDLDLPGETSEDTVVREIDVFLAPSIDAATQVCLTMLTRFRLLAQLIFLNSESGYIYSSLLLLVIHFAISVETVLAAI